MTQIVVGGQQKRPQIRRLHEFPDIRGCRSAAAEPTRKHPFVRRIRPEAVAG
jgi:hypothetical protein